MKSQASCIRLCKYNYIWRNNWSFNWYDMSTFKLRRCFIRDAKFIKIILLIVSNSNSKKSILKLILIDFPKPATFNTACLNFTFTYEPFQNTTKNLDDNYRSVQFQNGCFKHPSFVFEIRNIEPELIKITRAYDL